MKITAKTHVGMVRDKNEDCYFVDEIDNRIFIVADGMGGHLSGEIASKMAVETAVELMKEKFSTDSEPKEEIIVQWIHEVIEKTNEAVYRKSFDDEKYMGMGTTFVFVIIDRLKVYIAHVGDSRAYLLEENSIVQITRDHTLVQALVDSGSITLEESKVHPKRNIIMRALGTNRDMEVDIHVLSRPKSGAVLLMCTDGLTGVVEDNEIVEIFVESEIDKACDSLIELANKRGGHDNITVLAVEFTEDTIGGND